MYAGMHSAKIAPLAIKYHAITATPTGRTEIFRMLGGGIGVNTRVWVLPNRARTSALFKYHTTQTKIATGIANILNRLQKKQRIEPPRFVH